MGWSNRPFFSSGAAVLFVGDVDGDAPRLVARHQSRRRSPAGLLLEIDVSQRLAGVILHDEAGVRFLDGPRRREAAGGHVGLVDRPLVGIIAGREAGRHPRPLIRFLIIAGEARHARSAAPARARAGAAANRTTSFRCHSHHWFADGARKPPHGSNFLSGVFVGLTRFTMAS